MYVCNISLVLYTYFLQHCITHIVVPCTCSLRAWSRTEHWNIEFKGCLVLVNTVFEKIVKSKMFIFWFSSIKKKVLYMEIQNNKCFYNDYVY